MKSWKHFFKECTRECSHCYLWLNLKEKLACSAWWLLQSTSYLVFDDFCKIQVIWSSKGSIDERKPNDSKTAIIL